MYEHLFIAAQTQPAGYCRTYDSPSLDYCRPDRPLPAALHLYRNGYEQSDGWSGRGGTPPGHRRPGTGCFFQDYLRKSFHLDYSLVDQPAVIHRWNYHRLYRRLLRRNRRYDLSQDNGYSHGHSAAGVGNGGARYSRQLDDCGAYHNSLHYLHAGHRPGGPRGAVDM